MTNYNQFNTKKEAKKPFIGRLQPVTSRLPAKPDVNFDKGGSDFRCPLKTSTFGNQASSSILTQSRVSFSRSSRFKSSHTVGVGPAGLAQYSSMKKQTSSNRRSAESTSFGTSSRDGAWKLYAIYTSKRF